MSNKPKLELTWIGKDKQPQLEPRILIEDAGKSYGDRNAGNMLIHADNLLAVKALEQDFAGKIKCEFIDPPYNTGSAFSHYDDGVEHSIWLSLMRDRLVLLRRLLSNDGSLWITIDDTECHYLKVLCDEVFGRQNFVANCVWQKKSSPQPNAVWLSDSHDHILVYAKNKSIWRPGRLERTEEHNSIYKHSDEWDGVAKDGKSYGRGTWFPGDATASLRGGQRGAQFARTGYSANAYEITTPSGRKISPPSGTCWRFSKERMVEMIADHRITFGKAGNNRPCVKRFLSELEGKGVVPMTVWHYEDVGENRVAAQEVKEFNPINPFATPKPERLIHRVISLASNPGDLVLDSFGGSGTTGAVAHKMGRRWIMVELGEQCETHCLPRLKMVCDGTDQGGISEDVEWKGGGGFKYYELAPSLLSKDKYGNWVISEGYNANMLAAAMAKHEGFKYSPHPEIYWKHGNSSEKDFIFTTTAFVQAAFIDSIHEEMAKDEHLLICCKKYSSACKGRYPNIEIKKIPSMLLGRCEFGRDDYSLNIVNMPEDPDESDFVPVGPTKVKAKTKDNPAQPGLFDNEEVE
ncbi:MAG: site-specific DNA-methyltransferase [bacterium]